MPEDINFDDESLKDYSKDIPSETTRKHFNDAYRYIKFSGSRDTALIMARRKDNNKLVPIVVAVSDDEDLVPLFELVTDIDAYHPPTGMYLEYNDTDEG